MINRLILILLIVVISVAFFSKTTVFRVQDLFKISTELDGQNEEAQSMYQMPDDVLQALNITQKSGATILGAHTDGPTFHIPVLMYHYIEYVQDKNDKGRILLNTLPETLDKEIQTLITAGFTFVTASDLADYLDGIKQPPAKPVVLSFDDGYRDFYTYAFPILKKYNIKSVVYIISGFLGGSNYLTENQLAEIAKSGLVEIGSHTVNHLALKGQAESTVKREVNNSKLWLEQKLNIPITTFAYPYGSFDLNALKAARAAGFRTALSTLPGAQLNDQSRYFVYRLRPGGRVGQDLINLVTKTSF